MYPGVLLGDDNEAQNESIRVLNDNVQLAVPNESILTPYSIDFQNRKYRRVPLTLRVKFPSGL